MQRTRSSAPSLRRIDLPLVQHSHAGLLILLLCVVVVPFVLSDYQLTLFATGLAYSVGVLGVAVGLASVGMLALTQPAMMLIGADTALVLTERGWPFFAAVVVAIAISMIIALPLGWLTSRLDRFSFGVLGFAFTYLVSSLMSSGIFVSISGGELGKPFPAGVIAGIPLQQIAGYAVVGTAAVGSFASASLMFRSTMGRMLLVMRQDDIVASAFGVNTEWLRIVLTAIVSGYGALSGILVGQASGYVAPPQFDVSLSIVLLAAALVGGAAHLIGPFIGTIILQVLPALANLSQVDRNFATGLILLMCLILLPNGVLGAAGDLIRTLGPNYPNGGATGDG
ncbi:MAG: branched-chain amino acid ABC transporter permease [Alphaproteobacteria bacterium]|nr:branched-chain amino acid ABC transporter permease [Alphaproteobacteria bacterium]